MSDLCAPVYIVMGADEEMTFWCFVGIMDRMVCALGCALMKFLITSISVTETELPARPKWDEETAFDPPAAHRCYGSRTLPPLR